MRCHIPHAVLTAAVFTAACGGGSSSTPKSPTQPSPAPAPALTLACPAAPALRTTTGRPVPLTYPAPQATGGTAPVSFSCTPAAGTLVPVGETRVTCTATDARAQSSTCSFAVTLAVAPVLTAERFLSLGDSFTFGTTSRAPLREIPGNTYVQKLEFLLKERYPDQPIVVANAGVPGNILEQIEDRYPTAIRQTNAQVLILQGGANDLNADGARAIRDVVTRLERITRDAQSRGIAVILSTLTPHRPGSIRGTAPQAVRDLNGQIRDLCRRHRTGCADLYAAFGGEQSPLIGSDGLHPTPAGYDVIAETYFAVVRELFERTATP